MVAGCAQSRSQPFSIATTLYEPGMTLASRKLPSRSLWSLRNSSRVESGSLGTRTTIAPAAGFPARFTNPATLAEPPTKESDNLSDEPGATFKLWPEVSPVGDETRTTEYAFEGAPARTSYFPGTTSSKFTSPFSSTGRQATTL